MAMAPVAVPVRRVNFSKPTTSSGFASDQSMSIPRMEPTSLPASSKQHIHVRADIEGAPYENVAMQPVCTERVPTKALPADIKGYQSCYERIVATPSTRFLVADGPAADDAPYDVAAPSVSASIVPVAAAYDAGTAPESDSLLSVSMLSPSLSDSMLPVTVPSPTLEGNSHHSASSIDDAQCIAKTRTGAETVPWVSTACMAAEIHELEQRIAMLLRQREADWSARQRKSSHMRLVVKQLEVELEAERAALVAERARYAELKDSIVDQLYFADSDQPVGTRASGPITVSEKAGRHTDTSHRGSTASSGFGAVVLRKGDEEDDFFDPMLPAPLLGKEPHPPARKRTSHSTARSEVRRFYLSSSESKGKVPVGFATRLTRKLTRSLSFG